MKCSTGSPTALVGSLNILHAPHALQVRIQSVAAPSPRLRRRKIIIQQQSLLPPSTGTDDPLSTTTTTIRTTVHQCRRRTFNMPSVPHRSSGSGTDTTSCGAEEGPGDRLCKRGRKGGEEGRSGSRRTDPLLTRVAAAGSSSIRLHPRGLADRG